MNQHSKTKDKQYNYLIILTKDNTSVTTKNRILSRTRSKFNTKHSKLYLNIKNTAYT